jgi:hypothetical protein
LSAAEGRRFAFTLAGAFAVLGAVAWWRGWPTVAPTLLVLATTLAVAGIALPERLGPVERVWMGLAHALSRVTTPIFMGLVYYVVLTPTGVLRRTLGKTPLLAARGKPSCWVDRRESSRGDLTRQF